jgi:hypothetical protein
LNRAVLALGVLLSLLAAALAGPVYSSPAPVIGQSLPPVPASLKTTFMLGLANQPGNVGWLQSSGAAWDARYQYLAGGANTTSNWKTWQWDQLPPGQFASDYISESAGNGYLPVFTYYQLLQSIPAAGSNEYEQDFNNLNNPSTMNAYYADFKLLLDRIKLSGKTVLVHIEPDLWGFLQKRSTDPQNVTASVASSGYADVAGYPNNAASFARALVGLRDKYAPKALLAYHISPWASTTGDLASNTSADFNVAVAAQETAGFYNQTGANFDLLFYDISDRDAGYYASIGQPNRWWDLTNTTFPNFNRFNQFAAAVTAATSKRGILWQVPIGNTLYRTLNNTANHWQDNRVQYYLGQDTNQKLQELVASGIIGLLYGAGDTQTTTNYDSAKDGITNPNPINGNNQTALYSDDDGGYLRLRGQAYYNRGSLPLVSPTFTSSPYLPGATITLSGPQGQTLGATFGIANSGVAGSSLTVQAPVLAPSGIFSVTPATGFILNQGATPQVVTVNCTPGGTEAAATLTYTTNDPNLGTVTYNLRCKSLLNWTVTSPTDDGAGTIGSGTLSEALKYYMPDQTIVFDVEGNKITLSGVNPLQVNRGPVIIDGGGCPGGVPALTIDGNNLNSDGLLLGPGVEIRNILVKGFKKSLIVAGRSLNSGGNKLGLCVVARQP